MREELYIKAGIGVCFYDCGRKAIEANRTQKISDFF